MLSDDERWSGSGDDNARRAGVAEEDNENGRLLGFGANASVQSERNKHEQIRSAAAQRETRLLVVDDVMIHTGDATVLEVLASRVREYELVLLLEGM